MTRKLYISLFFLVLSVSPQILLAAEKNWREDTLLLPQYCKDRAQSNKNAAKWERWRRTFGSAYIHMHHYCDGLYNEMKARSSADKRKKHRYLGLVIDGMSYVSKACPRGCVLYPELHTRWGWALIERGQVADGIPHIKLAMQAKPTYTPAYVRLSDFYVQNGQPDEAKKVLEQGLTFQPKSSSLQRKLRELKE